MRDVSAICHVGKSLDLGSRSSDNLPLFDSAMIGFSSVPAPGALALKTDPWLGQGAMRKPAVIIARLTPHVGESIKARVPYDRSGFTGPKNRLTDRKIKQSHPNTSDRSRMQNPPKSSAFTLNTNFSRFIDSQTQHSHTN
jgi:hypothetical protein